MRPVPSSTYHSSNLILENKEKESLTEHCSTKLWQIKANSNNFLFQNSLWDSVKQFLEATVVAIKFI